MRKLIFAISLFLTSILNAQTIKRASINSVSLSSPNVVSTGGQYVGASFNASENTTKQTNVTVGFQQPVRIPFDTAVNVIGDLLICKGDTTELRLTKAPYYKWFRNDTLLKGQDSAYIRTITAGRYRAVMTDGLGFTDSTRVIEIGLSSFEKPTPPGISRDQSNNLVSSYASGEHKWYEAGKEVAGQTTNKYKPSATGYISVKTRQNGCLSLMSASYYYLATSIVNISPEEYIKLSPNPFTNQININFKLSSNTLFNIDIISLSSGKLIKTFKKIFNGQALELPALVNGIYIFRIYSENGKIEKNIRVVKI
jgi:hypothetical protein